MASDNNVSRQAIGLFDEIMLITTKNVDYLSAAPGSNTSPLGVWTVTAIVGEDVLCAKDSTIIKIPAKDVLLVSKHDVNHITRNFGKLSYGKKEGRRDQGK